MRRGAGATTLHVAPWPFSLEWIDVRIPFKRLPARAYGSDEELQTLYTAAAHEAFTAKIAPAE